MLIYRPPMHFIAAHFPNQTYRNVILDFCPYLNFGYFKAIKRGDPMIKSNVLGIFKEKILYLEHDQEFLKNSILKNTLLDM